jgi:hypothetical protein
MKLLTKLLIFLAIPSAAFLTFIAQPVLGKILTPRYGGSAGTWMTTSLFFQSALLLGYAVAFWLLRKPTARTHRIVIGLSLLAPIVTIVPPVYFESLPEIPAILFGLILSLGPMLILTTGIGILIQGWVARDEGTVPYYLYGVSNIGSAIALIAYPFWIEPHVTLSAQIVALRILLGALGLIAALLAWLYSKKLHATPVAQTASPTSSDSDNSVPGSYEVIPLRTLGTWVLLSFSTCTIMLASIRLLSGELGSNPFAWVLPLGFYLLSFTVTFTRLWPSWLTTVCLVALGGCLFGYASTKGFTNVQLTTWPLGWLLGIIALSCLAGHSLLYRSRPVKRFPLFYLIMASGGALAGLCATALFPALLARSYEFLAAALALWLFGFHLQLPRIGATMRLALCASLLIPTVWMIHQFGERERIPGTRTTYLRNYYGTMTVADNIFATSVSSDTTLHGIQMKGEKSLHPTAYYTRGSALGIVIDGVQTNAKPARIGVIGLGAGTLAAYARPQDEIVFWEINPLSEKVARENFTFLSRSAGRTEVRLQDGRLGLRADPGRFDIILVDAFSGDSIPAHLLTTEAISEYLAKTPGGFLVIHISNRYFDLMPVLASSALKNGWHIASINAKPGPAGSENDHAAATVYAVVYPPARKDEFENWVRAAMQLNEQIEYKVTTGAHVTPIEWTDERHAIIEAFIE